MHLNETEPDFEIKKVQSESSGSKDELSLTLKSSIHHKLRVIKRDEKNYKDEMNDRITEAEKETN